MKKQLLFLSIVLLSTASFAQDVKKKIDAQAKDPKTKENAAKADVFVQKKTIMDSSVDYKTSNTKAVKTSAVTKSKKKTVKKKS